MDAMKTQSQNYQQLLDIPNAVIFQLDINGVFTFLNEEWVQLTKYMVEETLGKSFLEYVLEKDKGMVENLLIALAQGDKVGEFLEIGLVSKLGFKELVHVFIRADLDNDQQVQSMSGTLSGLSSRQENVTEFSRNDANYRLISENMTDMVSVLAEDGLVLYASPSHTSILGRNLSDYVGSYPMATIHQEDWEKVFYSFHEMVSTWSSIDLEYRCQHSEGHWLYLEMKCTPIKDADGNIQVISVSRDITKRKKAEEELRQASLKLTTLISSLPYGVLVEDEHGEPTLSNEEYYRIFDTKDQTKINQMIQNYSSYEWNKKQIAHTRQSRSADEIYLTDGRTLERDAVPMVENGKFEGYLWIFRDVTEEKLAEKKLQEANQLLQKLSMADGLTGIANRRCFDESLGENWNRLAVKQEPISLLILDIDSFKAYNDMYGHLAGDTCIQQIAGILSDLSWGSYDLPARYGGEEFVVLLPGSNLVQAMEVAGGIHEAVKNAHIPHKGSSVNAYLTISIGVSSTLATIEDSPAHLIKEADIALYEAKKNGRNQIKVYKSHAAETGD
jgi:diguanylate cyclase (GGDEF)-like protein/PAS domain S-box-containing protein